MSDWCILRTASRTTMSLAASLAKDGFEVWTPIEHSMIRIPKFNVCRPVKKAMLGGFVFARVAHLVDLLELARMPVRPRRGLGLRDPAHDRFWVQHRGDWFPLVHDRHFTELRRIEAKRTPIKKAEMAFAEGATVKVDGGIFGGMSGPVARSNERITIILLNGRRTEIPTCFLNLDEASKLQPAVLRNAA